MEFAPPRNWTGKLGVVAAWLSLLPGMAATGEAADPAEMKELEALLQLPKWSVSTAAGIAAGYRDNVLLSSSNPDGSSFLRGELEAMLLRMREEKWDGYLFCNVVETRYFSVEKTDHERTGFITGEVRWQALDTLRASLMVQGYHHDQVFDVSTTEVALDSAILKVTGAAVIPGLRWTFRPNWWLEAKGTGRKDHYEGNVDGFEEGEGELRLARSWALGSELSLAGARRWRSHHTREQYTVGGRPLFGSRLKIRRDELTGRGVRVWDGKKQWRTTLTATLEESRDNGTGYFDFDRKNFTAGVSWRRSPWEVELSGGASQYKFLVQEVGFGIEPEKRHKEEYRATLEVTRSLTAALTLLGYYEWERSRSNDDRSRFRIHTGYLGVRWSWDNL